MNDVTVITTCFDLFSEITVVCNKRRKEVLIDDDSAKNFAIIQIIELSMAGIFSFVGGFCVVQNLYIGDDFWYAFGVDFNGSMIVLTAAEFFDFCEDVVLGKSISVGKKVIFARSFREKARSAFYIAFY